ncbi:ParB/RepB/Spo0J family partition protein [Pygmaiobacter massiliensis]|uniref:ParB/RepB/Spo0J family partition protein n=1 Tax=Pygmaiobacter massiliensis TaxID=1917873 RepID=UPI00289BD3AA|nr:ParB/RepB/Spo0J family partition protein [Pygmaiobacter massiliensis]
MAKSNGINLNLPTVDDLFSTEESRADAKLQKVQDLPLAEIDTFPDHPFQVKEDEAMLEMMGSIKRFGVLTPAVARQKKDGRYELISGHRRKRACELAGLETLPTVVRQMSRDEAIIFMVDSNLQREKILPSEKAFSLQMRLEAMNRQAGRPSNENLTPVVSDFKKVRTNEQLGNEIGESREQIRRYIRLTELIPEILQMVDEGNIAFRPAVEISYLPKEEQHSLVETMLEEDCTPSLAQSIKMKQFSQIGKLNDEVILSILSEEKPNQKEKFTFKAERLRQYIPKNLPPQQTEDYVIKALEHYQRFRERQKAQER